MDGRAEPGHERCQKYRGLVAARKACRVCVERSPGRIRSCAEFDYDPDVVSLWEQWLRHQQPKLLVVGQDFGNVAYFVRNHGRDDPRNKTNENLWMLLGEAGIRARHPRELDVATPVFLTNSVLCLKEGAMNAPIRASWVAACTEKHLLPLLLWLKPPVVVGMGNFGWRAVRQAFGLQHAPQPISTAAGSYWTAPDQTRVFAVGHCSPLGLINRPWQRQAADWRLIGEAVAALPPAAGRPQFSSPSASSGSQTGAAAASRTGGTVSS